MSEEVKLSLFDALKERLTSPLSGSFIIIWAIHHWELFLITFTSDYSTDLKITKINEKLNWKDGLIIPIIATIIFVVIMPLLHQWYQTYILHRRNNTKRDEVRFKQLLRDEEIYGEDSHKFASDLISTADKIRIRINSIEPLVKQVGVNSMQWHPTNAQTIHQIHDELEKIRVMINRITHGHESAIRGYDDEKAIVEAFEMNIDNLNSLSMRIRFNSVKWLYIISKKLKL